MDRQTYSTLGNTTNYIICSLYYAQLVFSGGREATGLVATDDIMINYGYSHAVERNQGPIR